MRRLLLALAAAVALAGAPAAHAHPGDLDATYADDGRATAGFGPAGFGEAMLVRPDGAVILAGETGASDVGPFDFALLKLRADGTPDPAFSGDGKQTTDLGGDDRVVALARQGDGKLVVAGSVGTGDATTAVVARYTAAGVLDKTFSGDGVTPAGIASARGVAIQADGAIVVAGAEGGDFAVARLTAAGEPDKTFSGDGELTTDFGQDDTAFDVLVDGDRRIVAVGSTFGPSGSEAADFALARYTPGGALDGSFAGDGKQTTDLGCTTAASTACWRPTARSSSAAAAASASGAPWWSRATATTGRRIRPSTAPGTRASPRRPTTASSAAAWRCSPTAAS
jgi:uncharacterized delta-60 repeat protein